ncbi:HAMP domain-containing sensor histidine kinase [Nisaea sp.]|uniref:sensor histidine kinase n=1 Tax=Nisaea sp. TaxID=2024842 RepID=UPI002B274827|nr:HAMP domain-containing sensor histidine kinase [Nisaea sp.]
MKKSSPGLKESDFHDAGGELVLRRIEPLFYSRFPALSNIAIAALICIAAKDHVPLEYLFGWLLLMGGVSTYRIILNGRFSRSEVGSSDAPMWEQRMFLCAAAQGCIWAAIGLAIAIFPMPIEVLGVVLMAACGMLAGATFTMTGSQKVFRAFVLPAGIGPTIGIAFMDGDAGLVLALMAVVFLVVVLIWGWTVSKAADERLMLAAEKEHLLANLELAHREAELEKDLKQETFNKLGHELRTPLNSIIGFAEIIGTEAVGPIGNAKYKEYGSLVAESGKHLSNLIDEMLNLGKNESLQASIDKEPVDVEEIMVFCRDLLAPLARRGGVELHVVPAGHGAPLIISAERLKLRQVLINLINNAIHYTLPGGRIDVALKRNADGFLEISVSDTGIGMAEADIPKALEPFNQLKDGKKHNPDGKGIGLALSKKFVELHGGSLNIESTFGVGTTIRVLLPAGAEA